MRAWVPSLFTSLNLVFGMLSIFSTFEGRYNSAAIFIILALVADGLDGRVARAMGVSSDFGKELDSLCDLGSFGVAPGILIYELALRDLGIIGQLAAVVFAVCGALRLARFNISTDVVHGYFMGMPIPSGGCIVATFALSGLVLPPVVTAIGTVLYGYLMISTVRYPDFKGKGNPIAPPAAVVGIIVGLLPLFFAPSMQLIPFLLFFLYTMVGLVNAVYRLFVPYQS